MLSLGSMRPWDPESCLDQFEKDGVIQTHEKTQRRLNRLSYSHSWGSQQKVTREHTFTLLCRSCHVIFSKFQSTCTFIQLVTGRSSPPALVCGKAVTTVTVVFLFSGWGEWEAQEGQQPAIQLQPEHREQQHHA